MRMLMTAMLGFIALGVFLEPLQAAGPAPGNSVPNILVLLGDDWRWDSLGCAGSPVVKTPHLDRLAADGLRFTQCRVTTSICAVSRATILTGQHMARHTIDRFGKAIPPDAWKMTYPAQLRAAGYHLGFVGKYGVGKPRAEDFDFLRDYEGRHWINDSSGKQIHVTEKNTRDAMEYLQTRPKDRPFCLSVSYFAPHAEDRAPEQYLPQPMSAKWYEGVTIPTGELVSEAAFRALPPFLADEANEGRIRWRKRFDTPAKYQQFMTNYFRLISEVDDSIGRLITELKNQGIYENTLILFTGDNGYFHGERGLADKWYPYEEALRVPLIIHDPRIPASMRGQTRDEMVLNLDIAPTLVAAAQRPIPSVMQGNDLAALYSIPSNMRWRQEFYYQHPTISSKTRIPSSEAVVTRQAKLIRYPEWNYEQLFDLCRDPHELRNLISEAGVRLQREALEAALTRLRREAE